MYLTYARFAASRATAPAAAMSFARARAVLGLSRGASLQDVKTAYRAKALQWHPDRNPSEEARVQFQEVRSAYEVASKATARSPEPPHARASAQPGAAARPEARNAGGFGFDYGSGFGGNCHSGGARHPSSGEQDTSSGRRCKANGAAQGALRRRQQQLDSQQRRSSRKERLQRRAKELQAAAVATMVRAGAEAGSAGLRRGAVLAAAPCLRGFYADSVLVLLEVTATQARGLVISGGSGGPPSHRPSGGRCDWSLLHAAGASLSGAEDGQGFVIDSTPESRGCSIYIEEHLTKADVEQLRQHLAGTGEPAVAIRGQSSLKVQELLEQLSRGQWARHEWATDVHGFRRWLQMRENPNFAAEWRQALMYLLR